MKPKQKTREQLQFLYSQRVYAFQGKELPEPEPGSYDSAKWTPPTHQVFRVTIQNDGMWSIELHGAQIASGSYASQSLAEARALIMNHCKTFLEG